MAAFCDELVDAAIAVVGERHRAILGIAGAPGAGKTTLTEQLCAHIGDRMGPGWVAHVPMDGFHLSDKQLRQLGAIDRKGAPDTFDVRGYAELLARVRADDEYPVYAPGFERDLEQPIAAELVVTPSARLIITEGNYLLLDEPAWMRVREQLDAVWFVDADDALRTRRLVARHIAFGKAPAAARAWVQGTDQRNADLAAATRGRADRVVGDLGTGWRFLA